MRLFLAINIEPDVRRAILEATSPLRDAAPSLNWSDESRLHLTLKFLGEQAEDRVASLRETVDHIAGRHRAFAITVGEVGAFPNFRRARVVWMGIERDPRLELLHHDIELACEQLGFELEGRAFRPHLTLARVRGGGGGRRGGGGGGDRTDQDELRRLARASKRVDFQEETAVRSIDLMRSNLKASAGFSRYERLFAAPLRAS